VRVLALAYYYPPNGGSGTHRSLHFLNNLAAMGDAVTVITAREADFAAGTAVDRGLQSQVHPTIRILPTRVIRPVNWVLSARDFLRGRRRGKQREAARTPPPALTATAKSSSTSAVQSFKDAITDALTFPDEHAGWIGFAVRCGSRALRRESVDCIYSSGGPWSSHVAAVLLKRRHHRPLVLDFRDPWASNPDRAGRSRLMRALDRKLESFCIRAADHVVVNTEPLRQDFVRRYPGARAGKFTAITNGFESIVRHEVTDRGRCFTLVHAGEIYPPRDPAPLLRALLELIRERRLAAEVLRLRFVGGCPDREDILALLRQPELAGSVEVIARVPHSEALRYQLAADVLLVFQTGFPLQVPRKLFEYMSMLKPVLAIGEADGATASIVQDSGVGIVATQDVESVKRAVLSLYAGWQGGNASALDPERIARYRNETLAKRLRAVMEEVSGVRSPERVLGVPDA
jgi:glycosyltransferase involved in cell wall biosynthesis